MYVHDIMTRIVGALLIILVIGLVFRRFNQPSVIGYLAAGIVLGPNVLGVVNNSVTLSEIGDFGVMLLLFFIGLEVSLTRLLSHWKLVFFATVFQILINIGIVSLVGQFLDWPLGRSVLLGFIISLSSTAVVLKILEDWRETHTETGQHVLGILLLQDIALIPMLITLNVVGGGKVDWTHTLIQVLGSLLIIALLAGVMIRKRFHLPFAEKIRQDGELQLFVALVFCFGLAFVTLMFGLSSALGAFVAGVFISFSEETSWIHHRLEPFKVLFVALFFVSIGLLVDLSFVVSNITPILIIGCGILAVNSVVMAVLFWVFRQPWRSALYAGALLSQLGEFGFVLVLSGKSLGVVSDYTYQFTLSMIVLTLVLSPIWISLVKRKSVDARMHFFHSARRRIQRQWGGDDFEE